MTPGSLVNSETQSDGITATISPISADGEAGRGAGGPRHLPRARHEARAHRHADHRHRGDTECKRDRGQQKFQPRAHAVAGQRLGADSRRGFLVKIRIVSTVCSGDRQDTAPTFENVEEHVALESEAA